MPNIDWPPTTDTADYVRGLTEELGVEGDPGASYTDVYALAVEVVRLTEIIEHRTEHRPMRGSERRTILTRAIIKDYEEVRNQRTEADIYYGQLLDQIDDKELMEQIDAVVGERLAEVSDNAVRYTVSALFDE